MQRSGWKLTYTDTPSDYEKSVLADNSTADFWYSLGFKVNKEGRLTEILWNSPAFKAGLANNATLIAVNGNEYREDGLTRVITEAKTGKAAIELLIKTEGRYETFRFDYHDGLKFPHLVRIEGTPDRLAAILQAM